jgi:hypothetical protein
MPAAGLLSLPIWLLNLAEIVFVTVYSLLLFVASAVWTPLQLVLHGLVVVLTPFINETLSAADAPKTM